MSRPVADPARLIHLDSLRGFALLGILLVNFPSFSIPLLEVFANAGPGGTTSESVFSLAVGILAEGKFYPLFSLLFGAGFALICDSVCSASHYYRRLVVLAMIGACHGVFIWSGDILLSYATIGLLLPLLFKRASATALTVIGITVLVLAPTVLSTVVVAVLVIGDLGPEWMSAMFSGGGSSLELSAEQAIYASGGYFEAVVLRIRELGMAWSFSWFWGPQILAYFLIGAALIRSGRLRAPELHQRFFSSLAWVGLPAGLVMSFLSYWPQPEALPGVLAVIWAILGGLGFIAAPPLLVFGYLGALTVCRHRLRWLAPAGRMALTLYLMQSLVWTLVFYGYGLGLTLPSPGVQVALCLLFFAGQLILAHLWFRHFRFGPVEWLWRCLTYQQRFSIQYKGEQ